MKYVVIKTLTLFAATSIGALAYGANEPIEIRIKNKQFVPNKVTVKAGERFKLRLINEDSTSEEFESDTLVIEKFLSPKRKMVITLGPLKPGTYEFYGELNSPPPKGILIAE